MTKMLSLENVELYYDHIYALKDVSIDLDEGETAVSYTHLTLPTKA